MKTVPVASIAKNIIRHLGYETMPITIIADDKFYEIASIICAFHHDSKMISVSAYNTNNCVDVFHGINTKCAMVLVEPETYIAYHLFLNLDFSQGEPRIPNIDSKVLIFPLDSVARIFSMAPERDRAEKNRVLSELQNDSKYRITTSLGTDLTFQARSWIPLDFEVCTAPIEDSIYGEIVVDGALFFKKIRSNLHFFIEQGKLKKITASDHIGEADRKEYIAMTEKDMKEPANCQLAEIGIGFCHGAEVTDCFMEAEAVKGTCHFCFGNNICYGGNNASDFHGASILIQNPHFEITE